MNDKHCHNGQLTLSLVWMYQSVVNVANSNVILSARERPIQIDRTVRFVRIVGRVVPHIFHLRSDIHKI